MSNRNIMKWENHLHPPESAEVGVFCISSVNCSPVKIVAALASAESVPI